MLFFFLFQLFQANCGDIQLYNQNGIHLQDKILIITKNGLIYNYDLKYQQIVWVSSLGISLQSEQANNTQQYIQPFRDGTYLVHDDFFYEIEQEDINLLFTTCPMFKNSLVLNNNLAFFMDISTGVLKKLTPIDMQQLLKKPKYYSQGVLIHIKQQYISDLRYEFTQIYNSKVNLNFLLQYIRGNSSQYKIFNNIQIWRTQNGILIEQNNNTLDLYLDNDVFQVFIYDNLDGLHSLPINQDRQDPKRLPIISMKDSYFKCEQEGNCLISNYQPSTQLDIYQQTELKQCLTQFYNNKSATLPIVYQQINSNNLETCIEIYTENGSITIILISVSLLVFEIFIRNYFKKQKLILKINCEKPQVELKYLQQNQIQINELQILGQGSHGTIVYEGLFKNKTVAVKEINLLDLTQSMSDNELQKSFAFQMSLTSQKFIRYYFYERKGNYIYLAMEKGLINLKDFVKFKSCDYISDSLKKRIKQKLDDPIFYQDFIKNLIIGLSELEKKKIKHYGLDQENIIFNEELQVVFSDLGISLRPDYYKQKTNEFQNDFFLRNTLKKQLGVIFYYLLSKGDDLKKSFQINQKIIGNKFKKYNIKELEQRDLIQQLLFNDSVNKIKSLLNHPYFWNKEKKLKFICEFSDYIETYPQKKGQITIQERFLQNQVFRDNWGSKCETLLNQQNRRYDQTQASQLIRLIRNTKNHYHQLTSQCQKQLGKSERDFFDFWNKNFPNLFFTIYQHACENDLNLLCLKQV